MVSCSTCLSSKFAFCVSNSDFWNVFKPLKPENIFCSTERVLLSESKFVSASVSPFLFVRLVDVELFWSPDKVMLGRNSLLDMFLVCLADSNFFLSAFNLILFFKAFSK